MEEAKNWANLPPDVLGLIFNKFCFKEKLLIFPRVCKSWNHAVLGRPNCWQTIDLLDWSLPREYSSSDHDIDKMLRFLVTRASAAFQEIVIGNIQNDLTFSFFIDHSRSLRTLEIPWSNVSDSIVEHVAEKLSGVTRINLSYCRNIRVRGIRAIGENCKSLVGLKRNKHPFDISCVKVEEATTIAATMPKLKHLELTFNYFDMENVEKIIESCHELKFLDIRGCSYVHLNHGWLQKCAPKVMVLGPNINHRDRIDDANDDDDDDHNVDDNDDDDWWGYNLRGL
ncbi:hypothetical protein OSB04_003791 [Centaurea solstitialis]|uniref:F-box domain-containing protein n=1 Tax=Centaurea solstitialis TaxID=347529 RepID=A0AA38TVJ9_9ASTR|nr:hypothetical protein OSB04_003791 [Centaurea solstitialis]